MIIRVKHNITFIYSRLLVQKQQENCQQLCIILMNSNCTSLFLQARNVLTENRIKLSICFKFASDI